MFNKITHIFNNIELNFWYLSTTPKGKKIISYTNIRLCLSHHAVQEGEIYSLYIYSDIQEYDFLYFKLLTSSWLSSCLSNVAN